MPKGQRPSIAPVDASAGSYAVLAGLLAFTARIGPHCPAVAINFHYGTILLTFRLKFSDSAISVRVSGVKLICCAQQIGLQIQVTHVVLQNNQTQHATAFAGWRRPRACVGDHDAASLCSRCSPGNFSVLPTCPRTTKDLCCFWSLRQ